jgi:hypothetical protein
MLNADYDTSKLADGANLSWKRKKKLAKEFFSISFKKIL